MREIHIKAPARIDIAGGTLDIWPLYLYLDSPVTINLAISLYARVKLLKREDSRIVILSKDQHETLSFDNIDAIRHNHKLNLITQVLAYFRPETGITIETSSEIPSGAGLAGSSTLAIALCCALDRFSNMKIPKTRLQLIARNIESRVIRVPAGEQDYYPALYGNLNSISFGPEGAERTTLSADITGFMNRAVLIYSGTSRNSGINNWEIFKQVIDGNIETLTKLNAISDIANRMKTALLKNDLDLVSSLIAEEWAVRKTLGPGVTTDRIDEIISFSMDNGGASAKVTGAGGGGCALLFSKPGQRDRLKRALVGRGVTVLEPVPDLSGVQQESLPK